MSKVQSQAGASLADIYNVQGSIAGIDQLETRELGIVHEMGATVFSERFATTTRRLASGAIAQSTEFDVVLTNLPGAVTRLMGIAVISNNQVRLDDVTIVVRRVAGPEQEVPIWCYNVGTFEQARFVDDGTEANFELLAAEVGASFAFPIFIGGSDQTNPDMVDQIAMRGLTTAFGAGTVTCTAILYFAFPFVVGTRSRGLPIPSW